VVSSVAGILSVAAADRYPRLPGLLALVVFLMIKANGGEEYELPVIGKTARQWV
jgi:uncharacterized membrane protein